MDYLNIFKWHVFISVLEIHAVTCIRRFVSCEGMERQVTVPNQSQAWTLVLLPEKGCSLENKALILIPEGLKLQKDGFCRGQLTIPGVMTLSRLERGTCFVYTPDRSCQTRAVRQRSCKRTLWIEKNPTLPIRLELKQEFELPSTFKIKYSLARCNSTVKNDEIQNKRKKNRPERLKPAPPNTLVFVLASLMALLAVCLILILVWHFHERRKYRQQASSKLSDHATLTRNQECVYDVINEDHQGNRSQKNTELYSSVQKKDVTNMLYTV